MSKKLFFCLIILLIPQFTFAYFGEQKEGERKKAINSPFLGASVGSYYPLYGDIKVSPGFGFEWRLGYRFHNISCQVVPYFLSFGHKVLDNMPSLGIYKNMSAGLAGGKIDFRYYYPVGKQYEVYVIAGIGQYLLCPDDSGVDKDIFLKDAISYNVGFGLDLALTDQVSIGPEIIYHPILYSHWIKEGEGYYKQLPKKIDGRFLSISLLLIWGEQ